MRRRQDGAGEYSNRHGVSMHRRMRWAPTHRGSRLWQFEDGLPKISVRSVVEGPAVIEEPNSTTLLYAGDRATVTAHGHLDIVLAKAETQGSQS